VGIEQLVSCSARLVVMVRAGVHLERGGVGEGTGEREGINPMASDIRTVHGNIPGPGDFAIEVVGESRYQEAFTHVAGGKKRDGCEKYVEAILFPENNNPYDSNAVQVFVGGYLCGYLDRETAVSYREQLRAAGCPGITARCKAVIVGGWDRGGGDCGHFGVKLDLPHAG
jgi:hypothetical protein